VCLLTDDIARDVRSVTDPQTETLQHHVFIMSMATHAARGATTSFSYTMLVVVVSSRHYIANS